MEKTVFNTTQNSQEGNTLEFKILNNENGKADSYRIKQLEKRLDEINRKLAEVNKEENKLVNKISEMETYLNEQKRQIKEIVQSTSTLEGQVTNVLKDFDSKLFPDFDFMKNSISTLKKRIDAFWEYTTNRRQLRSGEGRRTRPYTEPLYEDKNERRENQMEIEQNQKRVNNLEANTYIKYDRQQEYKHDSTDNNDEEEYYFRKLRHGYYLMYVRKKTNNPVSTGSGGMEEDQAYNRTKPNISEDTFKEEPGHNKSTI